MNPVLCLFCLMLVPLAAAGLALIHQGLGRSRSAAHAMLATLCAIAIAAVVFVMIGFSWAGAGASAHSFSAGGVRWDWLGSAQFFAGAIHFDGSDAAGLNSSLTLCLMMFGAGLAAMVPLSGGTDRWRLAPACCASALLAGFPVSAVRTLGVGGGVVGESWAPLSAFRDLSMRAARE